MTKFAEMSNSNPFAPPKSGFIVRVTRDHSALVVGSALAFSVLIATNAAPWCVSWELSWTGWCDRVLRLGGGILAPVLGGIWVARQRRDLRFASVVVFLFGILRALPWEIGYLSPGEGFERFLPGDMYLFASLILSGQQLAGVRLGQRLGLFGFPHWVPVVASVQTVELCLGLALASVCINRHVRDERIGPAPRDSRHSGD